MRKIFTLFILLLLLPVTALAADTNTVYVGGVALAGSSDSIVYATTNESGEVITEGATADNYTIKWDGSTLTLRNATIKESVSTDTSTFIAGAAIGVLNQNGDANLTITLEGTNTIAEVSMGIYVLASSNSTGSASLTITGDGILSASSGSNPGIRVQSNTGNGTLTITGAKVTASSSNGGNGVQIRCGDGSDASLTVNDGSLTATGSGTYGAGIRFLFGSSDSSSRTPSLTVSGNAIVRANGSAGGITSNSSTGIQYETGSDSTGGIVFDNGTGTVYGNVTLQEDITIGEGESLTIGQDANLTVPSGTTLTNNGTVTTEGGGTLTNNGKIDNSGTLPDNIQGSAPPKITTASLLNGTVGTSYSQTLASDNNPTNWSVTSGSLPAGLTLDTSTGEITGTPTTADTYTFTVTATNTAGSDSKEYTLIIKSVPVTGVKLDKTELSLYTGESALLNATVEPSDAANQYVTWATSDDTVVTVQATGNGTAIVTAVGEGTTTITVTTEDGGKKATCTVTVTHSMVHTPKKDATCTEDGNIEYWYCKNCDKYFSDENATEELSDVVIPATGHHYVNGYCTKCGHRDPDYRPDPISYYNIYVEDVCDGVEVSTSKQVVREGGSINVYVEKDTARYTFDNFKVYYKRSYYGTWDELKEGTQPGEYPIKNIWTHIYIKAEGAEEKEDPTGIESIEGVKVYTKDGSLYVQTPQREQVIIVSMSGVVVKNEEQVGLKQYHGLQPGIYIVRVGDRAYKLRLN